MSECKNKECTREAYVLDKPYCSSMCCISDLERQLEEAREEIETLKSEVFVIMRSGAHSDFPVSFKHTKEDAEAEALNLDMQEKFTPHYVEQLKEQG